MTIFTYVIFVFVVLITFSISLIYPIITKEYKMLSVQIGVIVLVLAGGIYGIHRYPEFMSIAKVLNLFSPLK